MKNFQYSKSPLIQVIIQIRFPNLLEISNNDPVEFHKKIREQFPDYKKRIEKNQHISIDKNMEFAPKLMQTNIINHQFSSEEHSLVVNLTNTFLSLSTTKYTTYEDITKIFFFVLEGFKSTYQPNYFSRIGLRYVDAINKEKYNKTKCNWGDLINNSALGMLSNEKLANKVSGLQNIVEVNYNEEISARIITSLGYINNNFNETYFIFDSDVYSRKRIDSSNIEETLNTLHDYSFELFDDILTKEMKEAMQ